MSNDTTVTFLSACDDLRLVRRPTTRRMDEQGVWHTVPGTAILFRGGRYVTADPGELEFLRAHRLLGGVFHEQGAERGRPTDSSTEVIAQITELAMAGKGDEIADILLRERTTASRPEVLAACETALTRINGAEVPPKPEPPEHELKRVRSEPASAPSVVPVGPGDQPVSTGVGSVAPGATPPPPPATVPSAPPEGGFGSKPEGQGNGAQ